MIRNLIISAVATILAASAAAQSNITDGRYVLSVGDFTSLQIANGINVEYAANADSAGIAVYSTGQYKPGVFIFNNNSKGKLKIELSTDIAVAPMTNLPTVRVYSQFLQEARNDGDSTLVLLSVAPTPKLKIRLIGNGKILADSLNITTVDASVNTGSGTIKLSGTCTEANLKCTGTGLIDAEWLDSNKANCTILGTGSIRCNIPDGPLKIKGSGTGKVYYRGTPSEIKSYQIGTIKAVAIQ